MLSLVMTYISHNEVQIAHSGPVSCTILLLGPNVELMYSAVLSLLKLN